MAILSALALLCSPVRVGAQALDTSVTLTVRFRRASTGKTTITTTIIATPRPGRDTVLIGSPARYYYWKPVFQGDTLRLFLDTSATSGAYPAGFPGWGLTCQNPTPVPHP